MLAGKHLTCLTCIVFQLTENQRQVSSAKLLLNGSHDNLPVIGGRLPVSPYVNFGYNTYHGNPNASVAAHAIEVNGDRSEPGSVAIVESGREELRR
ncbi:hypothetical protein Bpro_5315 (plasmid) [Polaromonas sp. JS666]|nr:hypothetical protein Bpro_5315 [Polaromonas sp. JS666]